MAATEEAIDGLLTEQARRLATGRVHVQRPAGRRRAESGESATQPPGRD